MTGQYESRVYADEDDRGVWVAYDDHLAAVEELEYELRFLNEENANLREELAEAREYNRRLKEEIEVLECGYEQIGY